MQGSNRPGKGWNRMECWTLYSLIQFRIYHRLELWARISFKIKPNPARFECFCWTILVFVANSNAFLVLCLFWLTYTIYTYLCFHARRPQCSNCCMPRGGRASSVASPARPAAMQLECGMWHGALMVCILIIFINDVIYYSICIIFILYYIILYIMYIYIYTYIYIYNEMA